MNYLIKYAEAYKYIQHLEGTVAICKEGVPDGCVRVGVSDYGTYLDTKGHLTAGFGHLLSEAEYGNNKTYWDNLTKDEAEAVYMLDFISHVDIAASYTPELHCLPVEVATHIIAATFRGSWGLSVQTRELFSQGKYTEAAREFLNSNEYVTGPKGIKKRMEAVSDAINSMDGRELQCKNEETQQSEIAVPDTYIVNNIEQDCKPHVGIFVTIMAMSILAVVIYKRVAKWQINY